MGFLRYRRVELPEEEVVSTATVVSKNINSENMTFLFGYFHGGRYERYRRTKLIAETFSGFNATAQNDCGVSIVGSTVSLRYYRHNIDAGGVDIPFSGTTTYRLNYRYLDETTGTLGAVTELATDTPPAVTGTSQTFDFNWLTAGPGGTPLQDGWYQLDSEVAAGDAGSTQVIQGVTHTYTAGAYDPATNPRGWSTIPTFYYLKRTGDATSNWFPVESSSYDIITEWTGGFSFTAAAGTDSTSIVFPSTHIFTAADTIGAKISFGSQNKIVGSFDPVTRTMTVSEAFSPAPTSGSSLVFRNPERFHYIIESVTAEPEVKPMQSRIVKPFSTALGGTTGGSGSANNSITRELLVPFDERAPWRMVGPKPYSDWTYQNYFFSDLFAEYPGPLPQLDGPRNVGTFQMPTAILAGRLGGCIAINPWRCVRITKDGVITTLFGWRNPELATRVQEGGDLTGTYNLELVGDWSAISAAGKPVGLWEPWNMAWDWETLPTDTSVPTIGGEPPHFSGAGPTLFVPDTRHGRILKCQANHADRSAPWTITIHAEGLNEPWALSLAPNEEIIYVTERQANRIVKIDRQTGANLGNLIADPIGTSAKYASVSPTGTNRKPLNTSYTITGAANNGSGLVRLTISSTALLNTGMLMDIIGNTGGLDTAFDSGGLYGTAPYTITVIDATHVDLVGKVYAGPYSLSANSKLVMNTEEIRKQTCIIPEGIDRWGDWIYWGSMAMQQVRRTNVITGVTEKVCKPEIDGNSFFIQLAVTSDATDFSRSGFGEPGTVFTQSWSVGTRGLPAAFQASRTISSITNTGGTLCTVTTSSAHGLVTNKAVHIYGATELAFNGRFGITVTGVNTFTYTAASIPSSTSATPNPTLLCTPEWSYAGYDQGGSPIAGKGHTRTSSYGSAVGVGYGAMYTGTAAEGLSRFTQAITSDPTVSSTSYILGHTKYYSRGYYQLHGSQGFGKFGHTLPWGEDTDIDYYLTWNGHQPERYESAIAALGTGVWSSNLAQNTIASQYVLTTDTNGSEYYNAPGSTLNIQNPPSPTIASPFWSNNAMADSGGIWLRGHNAFMVSAGGHNDSPFSGILIYNMATGLWSRTADSMQYSNTADPHAVLTAADTSGFFPVPRSHDLRRGPTSTHAFGGIEFMEDHDEVIVFGGATIYTGFGHVGGSYRVGAAEDERYWDVATAEPIVPPFGFNIDGGANCGTVWLPEIQKAFRIVWRGDVGTDQPYLFDPFTGTTEQCGISTGVTRMAHAGMGCVIPDPFNVGRKAYLGSYTTTQCSIYTRIDLTPSPNDGIRLQSFGNAMPAALQAASPSHQKSCFLYLGNTARFAGTRKVLVFHAQVGLMTLDIDTWQWSAVIAGSTPPTCTAGFASAWKNFFYDDINDVFGLISQVSGQFYIYKLADGIL